MTQYTFDDLDRMTSELWIASGDPVPTIGITTSTQGGPINEVQRVGYSIGGMLTGGTLTGSRSILVHTERANFGTACSSAAM